MNPVGAGLPPIKVLSVEDISQLPMSLIREQEYFTLLLAWDSPTVDTPQIRDVFHALVDGGLAYFCAWGRKCEAAHDAVDAACLDLGIGLGDEDHLCVTTWHGDESLDEAFWFFSNLALPSEPDVFSDFERFAVAIGNQNWMHKMQELNELNS
jgi:hypothetical protein